jgi:hypothetical protein
MAVDWPSGVAVVVATALMCLSGAVMAVGWPSGVAMSVVAVVVAGVVNVGWIDLASWDMACLW